MTPASNLRRPSHLKKRALVDHRLFDAPDHQEFEEAASKDHLFDHPVSNNQDGRPYQYQGSSYNPEQPQPKSTVPFKPQQPPQQPQLQQSKDSADWDTRATILLADVIVVTIIVGTILLFCLRKHRRRLLQQRITSQQIQDWTTITIPPHISQGGQGRTVMVGSTRDGRTRVRVDSNVSGMVSIHSRLSTSGRGRDASRMRVDSGMSGMVSVLSTAHQDQAVVVGGVSNDHPEHPTAANANLTANRRALRRLLSVPRRIGNFVLYPLRMLEAGVNDWATENYDETFLRQFMERLEVEREAARENPDDREMRLKEAFMKGCMVWELGDEHFLSPNKLGDDENLKPALYATLGGDGTIKCIKEINVDDDEGDTYGLYPVKSSNGKDLQDIMEEGHIQGTIVQDLSEEKEVKHETQGAGLSINNESPGGVSCQGREKIESSPENKLERDSVGTENECSVNTGDASSTTKNGNNSLAASNECTAMITATIPRSPSSLLLEGTAAGTLLTSVLPTTMPAEDDTFDEDAAPGYLYLSTLGHNRPRANTGGSINTSLSSSGHTTLVSTSSSAESVESMSSSAEASQDSHKIPNQCAICLCDYEKGDTVVTSCNSECPHAFHQECIVEWLVKMQDGTPCPCCRRPFVELDEHIPGSAAGGNTTATNNSNEIDNANVTNSNVNNTEQPSLEAEQLRQNRRRLHIEEGIRRGRAFNTSVISLRNNRAVNDQDPGEAARLRRDRDIFNFELGLRRGGRAFNTSVISLR